MSLRVPFTLLVLLFSTTSWGVGSPSDYEILGIQKDASPDEIKRAYRIQARRYHPDVNKSPQSEENFRKINAAYERLTKLTDQTTNCNAIDLLGLLQRRIDDQLDAIDQKLEHVETDFLNRNPQKSVKIKQFVNGQVFLQEARRIQSTSLQLQEVYQRIIKRSFLPNGAEREYGAVIFTLNNGKTHFVEITSNEEFYILGEDIVSGFERLLAGVDPADIAEIELAHTHPTEGINRISFQDIEYMTQFEKIASIHGTGSAKIKITALPLELVQEGTFYTYTR